MLREKDYCFGVYYVGEYLRRHAARLSGTIAQFRTGDLQYMNMPVIADL
jgi:hypothetical protein